VTSHHREKKKSDGGEEIHNRGEIQLGPVPDQELGRVADPALIRRRRREVPGEHIGGNRIGVSAVGRVFEPLRDAALDLLLAHQGTHRCIIGSDFGQVLHMDSIDGMRVFIRALLAFGIKKEDVKTMLHDNPAKLMYLD